MTEIEDTFTPVHPGQILKRELAAKGIKQNDLAAEIGILPSLLSEIIKGKRSITPDMSLLLAAFLECDPNKYNDLQANFNLLSASKETALKEKLKAINWLREIRTYVPLPYFRKQEELDGNPVKDLRKLQLILNANSPEELIETVGEKTPNGIRFKKSGKLIEYKPFVNSWLAYTKYLSAGLKVAPFDFSSRQQVFDGLKPIFKGKDVLQNLTKFLSKHGIKVVQAPKPEHAPLDGAAFWCGENPVICLTLRHKRLDNLVFVVYHELSHVYLHLNKDHDMSFVDSIDDVREIDIKEQEANTMAQNAMIPEKEWENFVAQQRFSDEIIGAFADRMNIPGASVLGRLFFEKQLPYSAFSIFKSQNQIN
ncbi:HigA family addiction module antitoxin [Dyadobacter sp. BHUBP1]|uniref:HigA family addiction module antitoxin n=1 Tax=Dyadobacter sp. BHUBP1 TaxID=3424178 RepID=UPI003D331052